MEKETLYYKVLSITARKSFNQSDLVDEIGAMYSRSLLIECDALEEQVVDKLLPKVVEGSAELVEVLEQSTCLQQRHRDSIVGKLVERGRLYELKKVLLNANFKDKTSEEQRNLLANAVMLEGTGSDIKSILNYSEKPFSAETTNRLVEKINKLEDAHSAGTILAGCKFLTNNNKDVLFGVINKRLPAVSNAPYLAFVKFNATSDVRKFLLQTASRNTLVHILADCTNLTDWETDYIIKKIKNKEETVEDGCFCEGDCECGIR